MRYRHFFLPVLAIFTFVYVQGCKSTIEGPKGPTTVVYNLGTYSSEEAFDITSLYEASLKALTDLELSISQKTKDKLNATIVARDAEDKKITIELLSVTKDVTKMSIRAGSSTRAGRIHQMIYDCLQPQPSPSETTEDQSLNQ